MDKLRQKYGFLSSLLVRRPLEAGSGPDCELSLISMRGKKRDKYTERQGEVAPNFARYLFPGDYPRPNRRLSLRGSQVDMRVTKAKETSAGIGCYYR